jgi:ADP-ribose pyrophosphatase YjhB (NUDIX family)
MTRGAREYPARPLVGIGVILLRPTPTGPHTLLIRRGRAPALGQWSLPGGAQRVGETAEQAARRELLEETGLSAGPLHLAAYSDSIHRDATGAVQFHYTILDFAGVALDGEPIAGGDATAAQWATEPDFTALDLAAEMQRVIRAGWQALGLIPTGFENDTAKEGGGFHPLDPHRRAAGV